MSAAGLASLPTEDQLDQAKSITDGLSAHPLEGRGLGTKYLVVAGVLGAFLIVLFNVLGRSLGDSLSSRQPEALLAPVMALVALTGLVWLLMVVWATDSAAYLVGRRVGGARLAPSISPGKTWAGLGGGVIGASLASVIVAWALGSERLVHAAGLGAGFAVIAQLGDLAESMLKRRAGVKDSGSLIPGHGGVLDRVDGLLLTAPALSLLLGLQAWQWP